jgi:hypothetical protein
MKELIVALKEHLESAEHTSRDTIVGPRYVTERLDALVSDGIATLRIEKDNWQGGAIHSVMLSFTLLTPDTDGLTWRDALLMGTID